MVDKIVIHPREVRGLGNIVMEKNISDFGTVSGGISSGTDTVNGETKTVFTEDYKQYGSYITVTGERVVSPEEFTISLTLKRSDNDNPINGDDVYCKYDDVVMSTTTGTGGVASFTITPARTGAIDLRFYYNGRQNLSGCFKHYRVVVCGGDGLSLESFSIDKVSDMIDNNHLVGRVTCDGVGVPGKTVNFYEEYTPDSVSCGSTAPVFDDSTVLTAIVRDTDGSRVEGEEVVFYGEANWSSLYSLTLKMPSSVFVDGESGYFYADVFDGTAPVSGETVTFTVRKGSTTVETLSADTNSNGRARVSYTGSGLGDCIVTAVYGTLSSSREIVDYLIYDNNEYNVACSDYNNVTSILQAGECFENSYYSAEVVITESTSEKGVGLVISNHPGSFIDTPISEIKGFYHGFYNAFPCLLIGQGSHCGFLPDYMSGVNLQTNVKYTFELYCGEENFRGVISQGSEVLFDTTISAPNLSEDGAYFVYYCRGNVKATFKNTKVKPL